MNYYIYTNIFKIDKIILNININNVITCICTGVKVIINNFNILYYISKLFSDITKNIY